MIRAILVSSLLIVGHSELQLLPAQAQVNWEPIHAPMKQSSPVIWETNIYEPGSPSAPSTNLEILAEPEEQHQPPSIVIWEVIETEDEALMPPSQTTINSKHTRLPPTALGSA